MIIGSGCIKAPKEVILNPSDESQTASPVLISNQPTLKFDEALPDEITPAEYFNVSIFFNGYNNDNLSVLVEVPNNILNSSNIKIKCNNSLFTVTDYYSSDVYKSDDSQQVGYNSYNFDVNCTYKQQGNVIFNQYNLSFFVLESGNGWMKNVTKI